MPRPNLKGRLVDHAGPTTKRIERMRRSFRPWNVCGDLGDFEALRISQIAKVCSLVPFAQFPQKLYAGIVEVRFFYLPCGSGAVQRQQVMASQKIRDVGSREHDNDSKQN